MTRRSGYGTYKNRRPSRRSTAPAWLARIVADHRAFLPIEGRLDRGLHVEDPRFARQGPASSTPLASSIFQLAQPLAV
jgi:hypothetical protein